MTATPEQIAQLQAINDKINVIPYSSFGVNPNAALHWVDAPAPGEEWECRDSTLAKADLLRQAGWALGDTGAVLCDDELGEYHAVQFARAGGDIYILDNRAQDVYLWSTPPYPYTWKWQELADETFRDATSGLI